MPRPPSRKGPVKKQGIKKKPAKEKKLVPLKKIYLSSWSIGETKMSVVSFTSFDAVVSTGISDKGQNPAVFPRMGTARNTRCYVVLLKRTGLKTFEVKKQAAASYRRGTKIDGRMINILATKEFGLKTVPKHLVNVKPEFVQNLKVVEHKFPLA